MRKYQININETFDVEAENKDEAYSKAIEMINNLISDGNLEIEEVLRTEKE